MQGYLYLAYNVQEVNYILIKHHRNTLITSPNVWVLYICRLKVICGIITLKAGEPGNEANVTTYIFKRMKMITFHSTGLKVTVCLEKL